MTSKKIFVSHSLCFPCFACAYSRAHMHTYDCGRETSSKRLNFFQNSLHCARMCTRSAARAQNHPRTCKPVTTIQSSSIFVTPLSFNYLFHCCFLVYSTTLPSYPFILFPIYLQLGPLIFSLRHYSLIHSSTIFFFPHSPITFIFF